MSGGRLLGALLATLVACSGTSPGAESVEEHPLAARAFRFCHTPGADAEQREGWCEHVDEIPEERCPGLRATCEGAPPAPPSGCNESAGGEGVPDAPAAEPEAPDDLFSGVDLDGAEALLRWVMALLVAFLVLLLARLLWTYFGRSSAPEADEPATVHLPEVESDDDGLDDVPEAPSTDLIAMASAALAEGRAGDAAVLARGAALRHLGEQGVLRLYRSRTDREYVRSVDDDGVRTDLRAVVATAEAYRFGQRTPPKAAAEAAVAAARRLVGAVVAVMLAFAVSWAPAARAQTPERYAPQGDAALLELYRQWGHEVSWRLRGLDSLGSEVDVLVLNTYEIVVPTETWAVLRSWVEDGGILVVAGDGSAGFPELGSLDSGLGELTTTGPARWAHLPHPLVPAPIDVYRGGTALPWVIDARGQAAVASASVGGGVVVGIADDDLLANAALALPRNEAFLGDLLYAGQAVRGWPVPTPIRVQLATQGAVDSSGGGAGGAGNNPLASLSHAELLPFVVHLLVVWTLLGLWRGWPFGPRRDPPDDGRLRFADHVEALGERYRRLGATRHVLAAYAGMWLGRLGPAGLQLAAQRSGMSSEDAVRWVAELESVVASPDGPNHEDDLQRMEELWRVVEQH